MKKPLSLPHLFLALFLGCVLSPSVFGQSLRWTVPLPLPQGLVIDIAQADEAVQNDGLGGCAFGVSFSPDGHVFTAERIYWINKSHVLATVDFTLASPSGQQVQVLRLTTTALYIRVDTFNNSGEVSSVIRKFTRSGKSLISKDTVINVSDTVFPATTTDQIGFFVLQNDAITSAPTVVERYSN